MIFNLSELSIRRFKFFYSKAFNRNLFNVFNFLRQFQRISRISELNFGAEFRSWISAVLQIARGSFEPGISQEEQYGNLYKWFRQFCFVALCRVGLKFPRHWARFTCVIAICLVLALSCWRIMRSSCFTQRLPWIWLEIWPCFFADIEGSCRLCWS